MRGSHPAAEQSSEIPGEAAFTGIGKMLLEGWASFDGIKNKIKYKQAFQIRGNHTGSRMHFSIQSNLLSKPTLSETKPNPTTRSQIKVGI